MNIEEERKAFMQYTALDSNVYNHEFGFWLKAKAHAEEMAKPVATWYAVGGLFRLHTLNSDAGLFTSVEEAKVWAQANGYRVVDK